MAYVYCTKRQFTDQHLRANWRVMDFVRRSALMSCLRNKHIFRCDQNGPPARRSEPDWQLEGAYPERYVTDEQRSRWPIFIATLWAAASWLFFGVARSSRIGLDMIVARALKNRQLTCGERHAYFGDRTLRATDVPLQSLA
jgi:hypothetical protein